MLPTIFCTFLLGLVMASAGVTPQSHPVECLLAVAVLLLHATLL